MWRVYWALLLHFSEGLFITSHVPVSWMSFPCLINFHGTFWTYLTDQKLTEGVFFSCLFIKWQLTSVEKPRLSRNAVVTSSTYMCVYDGKSSKLMVNDCFYGKIGAVSLLWILQPWGLLWLLGGFWDVLPSWEGEGSAPSRSKPTASGHCRNPVNLWLLS